MDDWDGYHNNGANQFKQVTVIFWIIFAAASAVILATAAGLVYLGLWLAGVL